MNKEKSVELLNKAIAGELQAIDQYLYFHFICEDRGYEPLAKMFERISIVEMKHVGMLALRVLFLKGDIEMRRAGGIKKSKDVAEMLKASMALEQQSVDDYNKWSGEASKNSDNATKTLFEKLVGEEEGHFDIFDTELENMKSFGDSYLALQSIEHSRNAAKE